METNPAIVSKGTKERRLTIPGWMYFALCVVILSSNLMLAYDYYLGHRLATVYHPTIDALIEVKIEWTKGYIKTAEILRGGKSHSPESVDEHFQFADWYLSALLEGGNNSLGRFKPLDDSYLRRQLEELRVMLIQSRKLSGALILETSGASGMAPDHEKLHQSFSNFIGQVDAIETIVQAGMRKAFSQFRIVQIILLVCAVFFFAVIGITFRFYEKRRTRDFSVIQQANERFQEEIVERKRIEEDLNFSAAELEKNNQELRATRFDVERQNWLKGGKSELLAVMNGDLDIESLGNNIVAFLCKYLNSFVGSFYVAIPGSELKLVGSYAYYDQGDYPSTLKFGQGLAGQAAVSREQVLINDAPSDYIKVSSSTGATMPKSIVVLPFMFQESLKGILELGALHEFNDFHQAFLGEVAEDIGMAVNLCQARQKMADLLEQTRIQAAELQAQQEELRVTNEELQEQTEILRESKERLQMQQEELRVANEELAERAKVLEAQKEAISNQNVLLEKAKSSIQQKAKDLDSANKYKSQFLANMSHELRTPLNSMLILSHLLTDQEKSSNLTDKQVEYASTIFSSGNDLLRLINDILDLSKVEAGKLKVNVAPLAFAELVDNCEALFREVAQDKGLDFVVEVADGLPPGIETDSHRLIQIVNNFLSNAFKFTEQGEVRLHICRPGSEIVPTDNFEWDMARSIAIVVSDTGIGIADSQQEAIFEAFQQADGTTSRKYGGTGLGLSISKELARLLGGEIFMFSEEGKGTVFTLLIPEHLPSPKLVDPRGEDEPAAMPEKKKPEPPEVQHGDEEAALETLLVKDDRRQIIPGAKSLLIIEDDAKFAGILVELGRERGYQCLVAEDGEAGLHFADFYKPSAIILDIGLPGIDGWQVMERLKKNPDTRHIPVHFISAHDSSIEAMRMGAIGYLAKPVGLEKFDGLFKSIEHAVSRPVKKLLVVEDNEALRRSIVELVGHGDVLTTDVGSGAEAIALLQSESFDCMILDLGLHDISGFDLLAKLREYDLADLPVIIYTGKELSRDEESRLQKYTDSIIVKGVKSPERLLEETTLFLHRVEDNMPAEKQLMMRMVHDREATLADKKVMIVDDDMRNVYALTSLLEEKGMKVVVGRDGMESISLLESHPEVDLILMDIMMPEKDGYEAIRIIREKPEFQELPIIALTAKAMRGDRGRCIEAGASDYLAKPVDSDKLLSLLRVWLYS